VPHEYRVLHKLIDTNNDGETNETEITAAIEVLEKAKREKQRKQQKDLLLKSDFYNFDLGAHSNMK
jgi:formate dehydrogenase maturation protein FdhE